MMMLRRPAFLLIAFSVGIAGADYEKGEEAVRAKRYDDALREFQADAERGDPRALESLAFMHSMGLGVDKDAKRAALYWRLAAMQGLANAQYMLGLAYGSGTGVERDDNLAKEWLRKAARRGHERAKKSLAENYPEVSLEPATGPWLFEQKYQREKFPDASFGTHGMCKAATMGYREWMTTYAENTKWKHHVYLDFEVGPTAIMLVNSAYGSDEEKQKVASLIGYLCGTFKTDW